MLIREFISPELYLERLQLAEVAKKKAQEKKMQKQKSEEQEQ
jgi:hypothetical protein